MRNAKATTWAQLSRSAICAMIANKADGPANGSRKDRTVRGFSIALDDARNANQHMHLLLYGLILLLMDDVLGQPAENEQLVPINVRDAPAPERVGIPTFIDIGGGSCQASAGT